MYITSIVIMLCKHLVAQSNIFMYNVCYLFMQQSPIVLYRIISISIQSVIENIPQQLKI